LVEEFNSNAVGATQKYSGLDLVIEGEITAIDYDLFGNPYVSVGSGGLFEFSTVWCMLSAVSDIVGLSVGDKVTVEGTFSEWDMIDVILKPCAPQGNGSTTQTAFDGGEYYYDLGEYQKAIEYYSEAIRLNPEYVVAYNNRGSAYYFLGQYERAIEDFDEAIRLNPEYVVAYINRGMAYYNLDQYLLAMVNYNEAIRLDSDGERPEVREFVDGTICPLLTAAQRLQYGCVFSAPTPTNNPTPTPTPASTTAVTPATVPHTPTNVTATAGDMKAEVTWAAPASNGGSVITAYKVTASPGGRTITVNGSILTATFKTLINGVYYTFTVVATNSVGDGSPSTPSSLVQAAAIPGAPTNVYAIAGNAQSTVTWSAPASTGGAAITSYKVTANPGGQTVTVGGSTLTAIFAQLTNGTSYTFIVSTINTAGTGASSSASNTVTPATVPGVPTNATAAAGNTEAMVFWSASASTGGAAITSYKVTANPGGQTVTVDSSTLTATFTGLTNGTSYTFIVVSTNRVGESAPSSATSSVTPDLI
jgi:hypothetical protein